jgi:hypothetical protein
VLSIDEMGEEKEKDVVTDVCGNWTLTGRSSTNPIDKSPTAMGKTKPQPAKGDDGMNPNP